MAGRDPTGPSAAAPAAPAVSEAPALAEAMEREARAILAWWGAKSVDGAEGGFYGEIDHADAPVAGASKGAVLNARILWFMSEAARQLGEAKARELADRAADYFLGHFLDRAQGGVFWALDSAGAPLDRSKRIYAQAFAIYALTALHRLTGRHDALALARELFTLIERRARDPEHGGYVEALSESWGPLAEAPETEAAAPRSLNTQLRVLEAYSALYAAAPTPQTREALQHVLEIFLKHIVDRGRGHLRLTFDADWCARARAISFGHDIEASWIIWEASQALGDVSMSERAHPVVLQLARACLEEAIWSEGGLITARNAQGQADSTRIWWVQAEALPGLLNAYELSGDAEFLTAFEKVWAFILTHHIDRERGEWRWVAALDSTHGARACKAGFWKGPYHNGRAMLEARARLKRIAARS